MRRRTGRARGQERDVTRRDASRRVTSLGSPRVCDLLFRVRGDQVH